MAHQMKHLCGFSVFHCVEGAFGASSGGTPKMKNGAPRDELEMVVVVVGPSLIRSGGICERTLVLVFVPGEHSNVPPFRFFVPGEHPPKPPFF